MRARQMISRAHEPLTDVFIPVTGVVSLTLAVATGAVAESATVGREGIVGVGLLLDDDRCPFDAWCQIPGSLLRVRAEGIRRIADKNPQLQRAAKRYSLALAFQVAQSSACYRRHPVLQRVCRRLLMAHDRVDANSVAVTQEMLGECAGARRADVNTAVATLTRSGILAHRRGLVEILDRSRLERLACECYSAEQRELRRMLRR